MRSVFRVYGFAIILILIALIPGLNLAYSGHGGPAWLLLPFTLPFAIFRMIMDYKIGDGKKRSFCILFSKITLPIYVLITYPLSVLAAQSIESSLGFYFDSIEFWMLLNMPLGGVYFLLQ
jgi:hypothetical protein